MLWKYKKCYQETNEEITEIPEICTFIVDLTGIYTGIDGDPTTTTVEYIVCGDDTNTVVQGEITVGEEVLLINTCIKQGSLFVGGVNIINEVPTIIPYWSIEADFTNCV